MSRAIDTPRIATIRKGVRIKITHGLHAWPQVIDVDTGEDLTQRIAVRYQTRIEHARVGQRVSFLAFLHRDGHVYISGHEIAQERIVSEVVEIARVGDAG